MVWTILGWGLAIGVLHFVAVGAMYGNPLVDGMYQEAMKGDPGVKDWPSRGRYLVTQFLGTQVEVYILVVATVLFAERFGSGKETVLWLSVVFSGLRVYPRTWNMWIQSTYPGRLLAVETINGVLSTVIIVAAAWWLVL